MILPKADVILVALTQLQNDDVWKGNETFLAEQELELLRAVPTASDSFRAGFQLGAQAMRVVGAEKYRVDL